MLMLMLLDLDLDLGLWYSYRAKKGDQYYAIKVLEDNSNLLTLRNEIAFQLRTIHENIVQIVDKYFYDNRIWVSVLLKSRGLFTNLSRL